MTLQEIKQILIEKGVYDDIMHEYNNTHTNGIPNTAIQSKFQEMLSKYNLEENVIKNLFKM